MIRNVPLGVYVPGATIIHRMPPLVKFFILIIFILITSIWVTQPLVAGICVAGATVAFVLARIPLTIAIGQLWPPLPLLLCLGAFQWWQLGFSKAATVTLVIFASLMLAVLVPLTTTVEAMMDAMEKALPPTARLGVPVETIVLAFSLTIRLIPLMFSTVYEVLDARKARGATFSLTAFGTPIVIRSIKPARNIADALVARGAGD